ncbi:hypothetical protein QQS21_008081 [Conoideocrella luteorostrata]|uniref:Uncharacterized protein n=1 Tax=Conoideocrella luteorostrata TaxID=1105319 RepID=A0AAJ0FRR6_9HYPO|nr:hypothetical protein QQS21_008081 [Conoideocrella luteorostrata]
MASTVCRFGYFFRAPSDYQIGAFDDEAVRVKSAGCPLYWTRIFPQKQPPKAIVKEQLYSAAIFLKRMRLYEENSKRVVFERSTSL